jgi:rare lipoprotein A
MTANCSSQQRSSGIDPKYGVKASPRVVADGQPVPKGGGRAMVGKPYQVGGRTFVPREDKDYSREGWASWYGPSFHGRMTANGEVFDRFSVSAAHPTMPLPSYVRVTNVVNKRSMIVRVNDRGPFHGNRIIDVSQSVADALDFKRHGTARVRVDYVGRASTAGSDDRRLMATLRTDGMPASLGGAPVMVASADPAPIPATTRTSGPKVAPVLAYMNKPVAAEPAQIAAASTAPADGRIVSNVPLPPERPFDLVALRTASLSAQARPAPRSSSLFFAESTKTATTLDRTGPFAHLQPQKFVQLKP